jgi:CubicO group peptidase (beta-lactamase class C family)
MLVKGLSIGSHIKIRCLLISVVMLVTTTAIQAGPPDAAEKLDAYLQAWVDQDMFSGVVFVAQQGQVLLHRAYGQADRDRNVANTLNTRFRIGSLTKSFTGFIVLRLEEQGYWSLNDPLINYLPDYPLGERITLDMLLNHRSGIVDHTTLPDFQTVRRVQVCPLEKTIAAFKNLPLDFDPGAKFKYSSSNYILLGYLIEKVTGKTFAEVLRQEVLKPLDISDTGFLHYQDPPEGLARGYRRKDRRIIPARSRVMQNAHGSGALYSTTSDLYTWCRAFSADRPLDEFIRDRISDCPHREYAYGWAKAHFFGKLAWAHGGDTEGFKSWIMRFPQESVTVIVLSNFEHCMEDRIGVDLAAIVLGESYRFPRKAVVGKDTLAQYQAYVGTYQVKPGLTFRITRQGEQLFCQLTGQEPMELHPESEDTFFIREVDANIVFNRDTKRSVTALVLQQNGHEMSAKKE